MPVICVDLSRYQEGFDFQAFKDGGGLGVILKATEGQSIADSCYQDFRQAALDAGLKVASYHFLRPGDMAAQARFFLQAVSPREGERVVVDWEDPDNDTADVVAFLKWVRHGRADLQLTVYTGHVGEEALAGWRDDWLAEHTSLWTAQYSSSPQSWASATWPQWSLWQYSDTESVPGFVGSVDGNRFNGSDANFLKWMGPVEAAPKKEEAVVTITTRGKVRIIVNGSEASP